MHTNVYRGGGEAHMQAYICIYIIFHYVYIYICVCVCIHTHYNLYREEGSAHVGTEPCDEIRFADDCTHISISIL